MIPDGARLFLKLEYFNPGFSIKDRTALGLIKSAMASGKLTHGGVLIESTSGNMGVGLAQACRFHGLRLICVVDSRTTEPLSRR